MSSLLHAHSPFRIFAVSSFLTIAALVWVYMTMGIAATLVIGILIVVEITFSFDNAIINARVLMTMNRFWQQMFMTIGILIAVFGMRLVFPIVIVMMTAGLPWNEVISLALSQPERYAEELERAKPSIFAFGGMFLLMLSLHFFFDSSRSVLWLGPVEKPLQKIGRWWLGAVVSLVILGGLLLLPIHGSKMTVLVSGVVGIAVYLLVHGMSELFTRRNALAASRPDGKTVLKSGLAGFAAFLYLEVLDASFSLDGVIGAFAITQDVVLIAIGLGVGALWVRSLTLFMVRRKVLHAYRYLEHGAHYTIGVLAAVLLVGLLYEFPEAVAGIVGVIIIAASVVASVRSRTATQP
jgi:hypothetical protein